MFEQNSHYDSHQDINRSANTFSNISQSEGFNRIVSIGFLENESQCLPVSRYCKKVSVLGLTELGAVSAIGLAAIGHKVIGVDQDLRKLNGINQGRVSSTDPKLKSLLKQVRKMNNLVATNDLHNAKRRTDLTLVCLGNHHQTNNAKQVANLTAASEQIGATLCSKKDFHMIVTCTPPLAEGAHKIMIPILERVSGRSAGEGFGFSSLKLDVDGQNAVNDFYFSPQITVSSMDKRSESNVTELFDGFSSQLRCTGL